MHLLRRIVLAALLALPLLAGAQGDGRRDPMQHFFVATLGDYPAELADARKAGKRGLVAIFMWDECPYCERMKKNVLSAPEVQQHYRERFVPIAVDTRGAVPITDFAGRPSTEKQFSAEQGIRGTPTTIFYDLAGRPLYRHPGEVKDAATMIRLADYVASGAYQNQKFAEFQATKRNP